MIDDRPDALACWDWNDVHYFILILYEATVLNSRMSRCNRLAIILARRWPRIAFDWSGGIVALVHFGRQSRFVRRAGKGESLLLWHSRNNLSCIWRHFAFLASFPVSGYIVATHHHILICWYVPCFACHIVISWFFDMLSFLASTFPCLQHGTLYALRYLVTAKNNQ